MASGEPLSDEQQSDTKKLIAEESATLRMGGLYRFYAEAPAYTFPGPRLLPAVWAPVPAAVLPT
eukprot:5684556-Heterocapsa_arctica.AAC.1